MSVITFSNVKGGVLKTTSALNLGAVLALEHRRRVLLIDLDPQSNLTMGLGIDPYSLKVTVYDVLHHPEQGIEPALLATAWAGLDLLPANIDLAGAEVELASKIGRESRLRRALQPVMDSYDFILIDTPPSLGLYTQNALMAARWIIVPVEPSYYALRSMGQLKAMIELIEPYNAGLGILGILLTRYDRRTGLTTQVEERLRAEPALGPLIFETVIPVNVKAAEAPAAGQPVIRYAPASSSSTAYRALAEEVLARER